MALSTYDSQFLTAAQQAQILKAQEDYATAKAAGNTEGMTSAHNYAESIRNSAGYSGLSDGSGFEVKTNTGYTNPTLAGIQLVDTSKLDDWKTAYIQQQNAELEKAYNDAIAQATSTYNTNKAEYESSIEDAKNAYDQNIATLYGDTYKNNILARQQAASRGLTSSAQGIAMGTSQLAQATQQASSLANDRDTAINKINLQLDRLAEDYNLNKDTLKKNLDLDKISALSTAEIQYISSLMDAMQFNATSQNDYITAAADAQTQYLLNQINNEFTASENQKDRELEEKLLAMQLANQNSYSGYGYSYGSDSTSDNIAVAYQQVEPDLTSSQKDYLLGLIENGTVNTASQVVGVGNWLQSAGQSDTGGSRNAGLKKGSGAEKEDTSPSGILKSLLANNGNFDTTIDKNGNVKSVSSTSGTTGTIIDRIKASLNS